MSSAGRSDAVTRLLAAALFSGFILTPRLWLSARSYPLTPVSDWLPRVPPPLDVIWFAAMLVLLLGIGVLPRLRWLRTLFMALAIALALWDQSRWQPWFYQYLAMFGALTWGAEAVALNTCRFILAATYTWSGIQKLNAIFVTELFPWLLDPVIRSLPAGVQPVVAALGPVVPLVEISIGIGLMFLRARSIAAIAAVVMHVMLLLLLGPLGHDWNRVVWPWNAAMALLVLILFWRTPEITPISILWPGPAPGLYARLVLVLFGVLPALHLGGWWDSYLSAALYSGNTLSARILISPDQLDRLPADVMSDIQRNNGIGELNLDSWAMRELNVPGNPARRIYRRVADELADRTDPPADMILVIEEQPAWHNTVPRETTYRCGRRSR